MKVLFEVSDSINMNNRGFASFSEVLDLNGQGHFYRRNEISKKTNSFMIAQCTVITLKIVLF